MLLSPGSFAVAFLEARDNAVLTIRNRSLPDDLGAQHIPH